MQDGPVQELVKCVFVHGELGDFDGRLVWQASALEDTTSRCKNEVASVKHELGVSGGGCLDAQAAEHGV